MLVRVSYRISKHFPLLILVCHYSCYNVYAANLAEDCLFVKRNSFP